MTRILPLALVGFLLPRCPSEDDADISPRLTATAAPNTVISGVVKVTLSPKSGPGAPLVALRLEDTPCDSGAKPTWRWLPTLTTSGVATVDIDAALLRERATFPTGARWQRLELCARADFGGDDDDLRARHDAVPLWVCSSADAAVCGAPPDCTGPTPRAITIDPIADPLQADTTLTVRVEELAARPVSRVTVALQTADGAIVQPETAATLTGAAWTLPVTLTQARAWLGGAHGALTVVARAYDACGGVSVSNARTFEVCADGDPAPECAAPPTVCDTTDPGELAVWLEGAGPYVDDPVLHVRTTLAAGRTVSAFSIVGSVDGAAQVPTLVEAPADTAPTQSISLDHGLLLRWTGGAANDVLLAVTATDSCGEVTPPSEVTASIAPSPPEEADPSPAAAEEPPAE